MEAGKTIKLFYKSKEWLALRYRALHRDKWCCVVCGASVRAKGMARVDHIIAIKTDWTRRLDITNVQTLCPACDNKKHREKGYMVRDVAPVDRHGMPPSWAEPSTTSTAPPPNAPSGPAAHPQPHPAALSKTQPYPPRRRVKRQ